VKRNITTGNVFENSGNNAVPRIRVGKKQEIETLINEEALLFAVFFGNEKRTWAPRIVQLN
jgi:hypothetical protein